MAAGANESSAMHLNFHFDDDDDDHNNNDVNELLWARPSPAGQLRKQRFKGCRNRWDAKAKLLPFRK